MKTNAGGSLWVLSATLKGGPRRPALRALAALVLLGGGESALAQSKTLVVAAGDCTDGSLLASEREFVELSRGLLASELLDHDDVINQVRPEPSRGLDDIERQIETARSLLFNAQYERSFELVKDALAGLDRASPRVGPWPATVAALLLSAQLGKSLNRPQRSTDAFRRVLRVEPDHRPDPNFWPPSTIRAFEEVRQELRRSKKGVLQVDSKSASAASVFVDGREVGKTPIRLELPLGTYRLSLVFENRESFRREVTLGPGPEQAVEVDMAFEGNVIARARSPLCIAGDDAGPLKLAGVVGANRVVVLRNAAQTGNPPYLSGVLYDVSRGARVRNAGILPAELRELMMYLFTGSPDISGRPPPAPVPVPAAQGIVDDPGRAPRSIAVRPLGFASLGIGAAGAIAGIVVFALAPPIRTDAGGYGYVIQEDISKVRNAQTYQAAGVGLMVAGAAVAAVGGAMLALTRGHGEAMETTVVPTPSGAVLVVGGRF